MGCGLVAGYVDLSGFWFQLGGCCCGGAIPGYTEDKFHSRTNAW